MKIDSPPYGQTGFDMMEDQSGLFISSMAALIALATTAVALRLLSRKVAQAGYWWDDVFIIIALGFSLVGPSLNIYAVKHTNFAKHIWRAGDAAQEDISDTLRMLWTFQLFFTLATCMTKLCILTFYRRIFPVRQLRVVLYTINGFVLVFMTTVIFITIFQCNPINKFWQPETPGSCLDLKMNLYATGSINTALDVIVALLPVPFLWQLRTSNSQKVLLTSIFIAAGFVCVVSILRLTSFTTGKNYDVTWVAKDVALWSAVEPCAGIISACMPSLRPLATISLRNLGVRLPVLHRWSITGDGGETTRETIGEMKKRVVGGGVDLGRTKAGRRDCVRCGSATFDLEMQGQGDKSVEKMARVENSLTTVESAMQRVKDAEKKGVQVTVGEESDIPLGEIRVDTEIRWSVMQRYDYDYRVF